MQGWQGLLCWCAFSSMGWIQQHHSAQCSHGYDHGMKQQAHAGLAEAVLKVYIDKNQTLRTGNWEIWPLDAAQQHYAALDAYASLLLYKASNTRSENTLLLLSVWLPCLKESTMLCSSAITCCHVSAGRHIYRLAFSLRVGPRYATLADLAPWLMRVSACSTSWQCPSLLWSCLCRQQPPR